MSVSGVSSALEQYQIKQDTTQKKDLGKNEFLELLVAQLNNQNPLEPQENGEFIAQLAQFSQILRSFLTGVQLGLGDHLHQWHAAAVEIYQAPASFDFSLASIFL